MRGVRQFFAAFMVLIIATSAMAVDLRGMAPVNVTSDTATNAKNTTNHILHFTIFIVQCILIYLV